ncbi:arginine N-succinyltransferase [Endozoicomonas elysicola]|uniref:Arginine N-succinyltransferase n=1 Tax=Endozoicomonas elysicola TaxID=305900 RepID=A0A081K8C0_9GAMM|nr:arginine N-succinyltransferase [Endozoicomonas elysicola]KEI70396.1 arginine N-succinyltransferase [Endozoicomonas elysicola]
MIVIRPIHEQDREVLWQIANQTGAGFTSLQPNRPMVDNKLAWALTSFKQASQKNSYKKDASDPEHKNALYLFVMEDTQTGQVVGTAGIESAVGLDSPWYNYKVSKQVHASQQLNVYTMVDTLMLCSDHTGFSELCTLFLLPDYRHSKNGAFLSKSRMMFMAAFPELFAEDLFAEMRGYCDDQEVSPFWEALGRHFFAVDFAEADRQSTVDKAFIAELMPRHPIYTNLLPDEAREVIGITHESTTPARHLLESEGFHYTGYVDIFDAGPLLEARVKDVRSVRESRQYKVKIVDSNTTDQRRWLMANNELENFRCIMGNLSYEGLEFVKITKEQASALNLEEGQLLRVVPLSSS